MASLEAEPEGRAQVRTTLNAHAESVRGGRHKNEDYAEVNGNIFAVADGMGSLQGSGIASREAVRTFIETLRNLHVKPGRVGKAGTNIYEAFETANKRMKELAHELGHQQFGTTLTTAVVDKDTGRLHVAHIGDSRLYIVRHGQIMRLTRDHTGAEDAFEKGKVKTVEDAEDEIKYKLSRSLMGDKEDTPDTHHTFLRRGDRLLISTDGLHTLLPDIRIREILIDARDARMAAKHLVAAADEVGARRYKGQQDNITALVYFHKH